MAISLADIVVFVKPVADLFEKPDTVLVLFQRAEETAPGSSHSSRGASRQSRSRS
jgi:hypothetical protein